MKIRLVVEFEQRNVPFGSTILADALPGSSGIDIETDEEHLHRDVMTEILRLGDNDTRVTRYEVWMLLDERKWDEPFEPPTIPPERIAELQAILNRVAARRNK